jgi:hypothetical protein
MSTLPRTPADGDANREHRGSMSDHTSPPGHGQGSGRQAGERGQAISRSLFSAGLDLNYVLMTLGPDSLAGPRLRHAIEELDSATVSLRHLMVEQGLHDTLAMCQQVPPSDPPPSRTPS